MFGVVWPCLQEDHFFVRKAWHVARKRNQFGCGGLAGDLKVKVLCAGVVVGAGSIAEGVTLGMAGEDAGELFYEIVE
ncbi:hypothetical protein [Pseudomonas saxonica]|uniref:hypothetical protein n=1 Tax=Pseudomonas saxonica TaxID=2600598 RepID=UPI002D765886|nr:hypothetical protein [Pseudomonas saxonica]WRQ77084.1 hypothetical protein VQY67_11095 [Pseudomonas saxonica]